MKTDHIPNLANSACFQKVTDLNDFFGLSQSSRSESYMFYNKERVCSDSSGKMARVRFLFISIEMNETVKAIMMSGTFGCYCFFHSDLWFSCCSFRHVSFFFCIVLVPVFS